MKYRYQRPLQVLVLSLALPLVVFGSTALAAESALTVNQAIKLAQQQNIGLKQAELAFDSAKITYNKTMASGPADVAKRSAEIAWEKAQIGNTQAKADVVTGALSSYLNLQNAAFDVIIKEKQANAAQRSWDRTKIYVQKGTASKLDELQAELGYMSAINSLDRARDSYAESSAAYAHMLGLDKLPQLTNDDFLMIPEFRMSLSEALEVAAEHSISVKEKEVAYELALIQRAQDELLELAPVDEQLSQNALKAAELALAKAKYDMEESITASYNGLMQAGKGLTVAQSSQEIEVRRFDIVKKQFDAGLKTPSDLDSGEVALLQAQGGLRTAQRAYVLAWLSFQKALGNEIDLSGVVKPDATN